MLNEDEMCDAVLFVFANLRDLPNAMCAAEVTYGSCHHVYIDQERNLGDRKRSDT